MTLAARSTPSLSFNEFEALVRKAIRGRGYPWGIAEDGGKLCRELAGYLTGIDRVISEILSDTDVAVPRSEKTDNGSLIWIGGNGLTAACCMLDHSGHPADRMTLKLDSSEGAELLASAALVVCRQRICNASLNVFGKSVDLSDLLLNRVETPFFAASPSNIEIHFKVDGSSMPEPIFRRVRADLSTIKVLEKFAALTYAPETESSKRTGAGAGLTDND